MEPIALDLPRLLSMAGSAPSGPRALIGMRVGDGWVPSLFSGLSRAAGLELPSTVLLLAVCRRVLSGPGSGALEAQLETVSGGELMVIR